VNLGSEDLEKARRGVESLMWAFHDRMERGDPMGDLFREEAVFVTMRGEHRGRGAIVQHLTALGQARRQSDRVSRHGILDLRVTRIGERRYEARSLILAFAADDAVATGGSMMIADQLDIVEIGSDGVYQFAERRLRPALEFLLTPKK
jgi:hypothetical protein